ncbi:unnamed protein product [Dracunculus medinensis]|uniref:ABC2_membrane domain-containing protein n=1 Tax=Dracunculus medinensis TaxID=318479 RepID=A0A0N4UK82_DRAME|nr:unnamed protein product [Dracunculus medinensis]
MKFDFFFFFFQQFCSELPIFLREHRGGLYRSDTYFLAKNIAEIPQFVLLPLLFTTILYWMAGLTPEIKAFSISCLICILMANVATSYGYLMSCVFKSIGVSLYLINVIILPSMITAGFFINLATLPPYYRIFQYISYFGYAYEALAIIEWTHIDSIPGCINDTNCYRTGNDVLDFLDFKISNFYRDIFALITMIFVIRIIAYVALYLQTRKQ